MSIEIFKPFPFVTENIKNNIRAFKSRYFKNNIINKWVQEGKPVPPPHEVKQVAIEKLQSKYKIRTLVETGTYLGDMVIAQKDNFTQIYSIELSEYLWKKALKRCAKYKHIKILQGNSGVVLKSLMPELNMQTLFWLDGHYSGGITAKGEKECPVLEEMDAILEKNENNHIILIDDARCFTGQGDYPTLNELESYVKSKNVSYSMSVENDIIHFIPNE